jgi:hypothetical protein
MPIPDGVFCFSILRGSLRSHLRMTRLWEAVKARFFRAFVLAETPHFNDDDPASVVQE